MMTMIGTGTTAVLPWFLFGMLLIKSSPSVLGWSSTLSTTNRGAILSPSSRIRMSFFLHGTIPCSTTSRTRLSSSSENGSDQHENLLENDLVSIKVDGKMDVPRLCVVTVDGTIAPLCSHEDDVETDLFIDPRRDDGIDWDNDFSQIRTGIKGTYGEGWYGQRPVPSLGGGPGYGAPAQDIWSIDEDLLEQLAKDGVEIPILDVGIAHGEQARGGAF